MSTGILNWIKLRYHRIVTSISFLPAVIAIAFLLVSFMMLALDKSQPGKNIKSQLSWLTLKDASTARSIISAVVTGIMGLTVFSFSMVMIVLNQAASHMSNRVLDNLIGDRFQQFVLGFYIGTTVYALFLLSTIRDIDNGIYVPALSTYLLIVLTIFDIFLFIYFLHFVTQTVKYETVIRRVHERTRNAMKNSCRLKADPPDVPAPAEGTPIDAPISAMYLGFEKVELLEFCKKHDCEISFGHILGAFVLKGTPLFSVSGNMALTKEDIDALFNMIRLQWEESVEINYYYGFRQLYEVAVKALSPGINDPGTAALSLHALADLLTYRLSHFPDPVIRDENNRVRIRTKEKSFEDVFLSSIMPIWDYGQNDRTIQVEVQNVLMQLNSIKKNDMVSKMLHEVNKHLIGSFPIISNI